IIASAIVHPSVTETLDQLTELFGFVVTYLPADQNGFVSLKDVKSAIRPGTIIVSVMHVNNDDGSIPPEKESGGFLKQYRNI
ncbi:aminotransferase class V-fold PLP-dependent enzyme, partial [Bacillus sp. GbtcB15]|uniref:aminotransferase class V-fold PLP-dependent enzyme n=1 Tax=Bacillus sp. GbtcB15 TaxID=2824760 RepID=UPI001C2F92D2